MEFKENSMNTNNMEKLPSPHELARQFEQQLKAVIVGKYSLKPEALSLLLDDRAGVYFSKKQKDLLCCLILGLEDGHMYLVSAEVQDNGKEISNFKSDIIS